MPLVTAHQNMKKRMLQESKTFCIYPWIHLHTTPTGTAAPCCIAESVNSGVVGNSREKNLMELVNSFEMSNINNSIGGNHGTPDIDTSHHPKWDRKHS